MLEKLKILRNGICNTKYSWLDNIETGFIREL